MNFIIILESLIFASLSGLHFYWAMGGKFGFSGALPEQKNGHKVFIPTKLATIMVALGLLLFGLISLSALPIFQNYLVKSWIFWLNLGIAGIFLLRAMGDFKYVGFSKQIKNTQFARNDSQLYAPLCLLISILNTWIAFSLSIN